MSLALPHLHFTIRPCAPGVDVVIDSQITKEPLIGITASNQRMAQPYQRSVESRGATTRLILPRDAPRVEAIAAELDALLLTGGEDIDPTLYGQSSDPNAGLEVLRRRDEMELPLLRAALDRDLPVLCICRGMQLLNVALGGTLIQDLPSHRAERQDGRWVSAHHQIYLSPGSKLAAILGTGGFFRVNSRHHQGLYEAQKAPGLLASAYFLQDGLIEGLELPGDHWVIGLQCHPELEEENPKSFDRLFQAFVERAAQTRELV